MTALARGALRAINATLRTSSMPCFVLILALVNPRELSAQAPLTKSTTATQPDPAATASLARYVSKDNLIAYMEFEGLDAHAASWLNTAACKMLNDTPLGVMIEEVSGQLIDKALGFLPARRLSGPEIVALLKNATKSGWVLALHVDPKTTDIRVSLVLRGAVSKSLKPISSRLMGWLMGTAKFKIERKDPGRTMVVVPYGAMPANAGAASASWVWWPEKNDLVIGSSFPGCADVVCAALDGKAPSAVEHPIVQELKKPEGTFEPVCVSFVDTAGCPDSPARLAKLLRDLDQGEGINRIDLRWGFDADALMSVTRLVAPKPWKTGLAIFDQPTFDKTSLMAMPESIESFVELSISPSKVLEALEQVGPAGAELRAQIEQLSETIKTAGQIDLKKDILGHLGPRMVAYLAPGRSATTNDDSLEEALKNGLTTSAAVTVMQSYFPKITLVAEVDNPEAFGKGLDTAMIAINNELKAQAMEKEAEDHPAAEEKGAPDGAGRAPGGRAAGGADRTKRRRPKVPSYPHFQTTIGQANSQSSASPVKSFVLMTPIDSPLRFGPSSFRPTILLEDKYVAFAVSSDAARAAIAAAKRKDWKPSSDLQQACEKVPSNMIVLSVNDVRESLSSLLASLPGTLQTMINTSIALAKARAGGAVGTAAPNGASPANAAGMSRPVRGGVGGMMKRGGPRGAATGESGAGPGPGGPGGSPGIGSAGAATDSMIVLKVDPDKLPKAAELKAHIFPTTLSISLTEREIRLTSRGAFPDLSQLIGLVPAVAMMPGTEAPLAQLLQAQPATPAQGPGGATATGATASPAIPQNPPPDGRRRGRRPD